MTLTHPAIDADAVARLRRHLGRPEPVGPPSALVPIATPPATLGDRARALAGRVAAPLVERARQELARAAEHEQAALHAELHALRAELDRTRTTHAAELAALHEQLRDRP
ncbi:hypothetical protein KSP35_08575 [Aquihabitans sp. G128]|uniref:hypothetical protein n=1 Tax=Aquihabitans sp. G128 TaxID=2849779 RepID=UPI001C24CE96|nr:hypothetical protein [Aquihabitans sp. G128]QXC62816.1 hypothetical protein KSP35_08575 [Aquihabitans sp. G128]